MHRPGVNASSGPAAMVRYGGFSGNERTLTSPCSGYNPCYHAGINVEKGTNQEDQYHFRVR